MKKRRKIEKTNEEKKKQADFLSFTSIVFGVVACVLCCVRVVGFVFAILSLILSIIAICSGGKKILAVAAILIALLSIGFNFAALSAVSSFLSNFAGTETGYNSYDYGY